MPAHNVTMLGTGLIGGFYTMTLHGQRGRDRVGVAYSRSADRARAFAERWDVPRHTADLAEAVETRRPDTVVIGLPNHLHEEAVTLAAGAGKAILCTKPLGRDAAEARRMLETAERAGVFHGYLEDLVYTPKTLKAVDAVRGGAVGDVLWVRSRETHPGPHSAWFWSLERPAAARSPTSGATACEIVRSFVGKGNRPVEVMCWSDTLVHPIEAEDHAIALVRFESGAVGQVEVSWAFRGGMDLRDEVAGTQGTIMLNHWLRTGFEMYTAGGSGGYVAEKLESDRGWLFPVGRRGPRAGLHAHVLRHVRRDGRRARAARGLLRRLRRQRAHRRLLPLRALRQWEPVTLDVWRAAGPAPRVRAEAREVGGRVLIKEERMPDGTTKQILRDPATGEIVETTAGVPVTPPTRRRAPRADAARDRHHRHRRRDGAHAVAAGARVCVAGVDAASGRALAESLATRRRECRFVEADVTQPDAVAAAVEACAARSGGSTRCSTSSASAGAASATGRCTSAATPGGT
jgi:predicted dehydrogenase